MDTDVWPGKNYNWEPLTAKGQITKNTINSQDKAFNNLNLEEKEMPA